MEILNELRLASCKSFLLVEVAASKILRSLKMENPTMSSTIPNLTPPPVSVEAIPESVSLVQTSVDGATGFLNRLTNEKDKFVNYVHALVEEWTKDIDPQTLAMGVSIATTLSLGGAAAIFYYARKRGAKTQKSKSRVNFQEAASPVQLDSNNNQGDSKAPGVLVLHQCPRGRRTPSIAPYPLKLETFLRVHDIHYEVDFSGSEPRTSNSPWITLDLEDISDSQNCLKYIMKKYNIDPEQDNDNKQRAIALAYNHLLENHLYWGIALWRWVYDGARSLKDIQLLPKKTTDVIPDVSKTVEQAAWFHGLGKKTPKDVIAAVIEDLKSLSDFLGKKKFFLGGDKATELDCTAFAMLSQMLWNMDGSPFQTAVSGTYKNLADFCWRMRVRYWPDWDNCLNNNEVIEVEQ